MCVLSRGWWPRWPWSAHRLGSKVDGRDIPANLRAVAANAWETNTSQNAKTFETLTLWLFNSSTLPNSGLCQMIFHQTLVIFRVHVRWELSGLASVPSTAIRSCSAQFDEWPKATLVRSPGGVWCVHGRLVSCRDAINGISILNMFLPKNVSWPF